MKNKQGYVYELGPSFRTQGGISSVLYTYYVHYAGRLGMRFIPTYSGRSRIMDFIFFGCALFRVFFICLFNRRNIFHIHTSTYGSYLRKSILARLCLLFGCKTVLHIHGSDFDDFMEEASEWKRKRIIRLLNRLDKVIVLSESWRKFFSKYVSSEKILVIYNPIHEIKEAYTARTNAPVKILFMGRIGQRKGAYDLIEAVRELPQNTFILELYGDGENRKIKALVEKYLLEDCVRVNDWVSHEDVIQIYDASDILVLPSYSEGLPMSVIEAMGRALPVVASEVGGIPEAVEDGYNGYIVRHGDIPILARQLQRLVEDGAMREEMGRRSLERAKEKFSVDTIGARLGGLFSELRRGGS